MIADRSVLASDQERENIVALLRDAHAAGRLWPEEFYRRLDAAYAARTWADLDRLIADLPLPWTAANLPWEREDAAGRARSAGGRFRQGACMFLLVLTAGLAGHTYPVMVWVACILIPAVLFLQWATGRMSAARRQPAGRGQVSQQYVSAYDISWQAKNSVSNSREEIRALGPGPDSGMFEPWA